MNYQQHLQNLLNIIVGKKLNHLKPIFEVMSFGFGEYALHTLGLTRIIKDNDILVTTLDYQNWDGEEAFNNDEHYFIKKFNDQIVGGVVTSIKVSPLYDLKIEMDNGVRVEVYVQNGHHHFDRDNNQWLFFKVDEEGDNAPFVSVYNKTVDITGEW
ncbi:MAG: hypothetical protein IKC47_03660 [Clostridia bacterium]|nr:hypothetical protein [Clostridia bacterium]